MTKPAHTHEVAALRREYANLHQRVLDAYKRSTSPDIAALQSRETKIVSRLRALGSSPYAAAEKGGAT